MSWSAGSLNTRDSRLVMKEGKAWLAHFPSLHTHARYIAVFATVPFSVCLLEASHVPSRTQGLCLLNCSRAPEVSPSVFPLMPPVCMFDSHSKRKTLWQKLRPQEEGRKEEREERDALHCAGIHTALRWPAHRKRLFALATGLHRDGTDPMCRTEHLLKHFPLVGFWTGWLHHWGFGGEKSSGERTQEKGSLYLGVMKVEASLISE